jgi:hypothetical protein
MKRVISAVVLVLALIGAASGATTVTGQVLDYEKGYLFFTTGDGFRVAANADIVNGAPHTRDYARVTFDSSGTITRIETSHTKLPPEGDLASLHHFAIALSTPAPNPDLAQPPAGGLCGRTVAGKQVGVRIVVQVPPNTPLTDTIYLTTDQSGWNPQAYRLDRLDGLHYGTILKLLSGTHMELLVDRGSAQSIMVAQNGIEQKPMTLCVGDSDAQAFRVQVYRWADEQGPGSQQIPTTFPTPFNPAPFPNLPQPTPHP